MTARQCRPSSCCCNRSRAKEQDFRHRPRVSFAIVGMLSLIGIVALLLVGCNEGRPPRVPVSGQVLIDGKPLTYGDLKFVPEGARPSYAKLDSNGGFTLTCYDGNDGVVPGLHRVAVSGSEVKQGQSVWHAPIKYANFRTSGITVQIDSPTNSLVIELGSDGRQATVHIDKP
jgi:hypothetical protein